MSSYLISSTKKSSGKTIISIGLAYKFRNKKISVFKKGPDYIDPLWIKRAAKQDCFNLDFYTMTEKEIENLYRSNTFDSNISIVEGNKGLFDGLSLDGKDSNAALAKLLKLEVILVVDCNGITRGIAPIINGYEIFDKKINYKGVILNNIASERHEGKLVNAINEYTSLNIIGSVYKNKKLQILEQHLGLKPDFIKTDANKVIKSISSIIASSVDTDKLIKISRQKSEKLKNHIPPHINSFKDLKIGIASDESFGFYYPDDLKEFISYGVKIVYFNTFSSTSIPRVDAIFIGGGFPEIFKEKLSRNKKLINSLHAFIESGKPVYAECGGLMYLCDKLIMNNRSYKMAGILNADVTMHDKPIGRGYVDLLVTKDHPWMNNKKIIKAHEFHYSSIKINDRNIKYGFNVKRGYGLNGKSDGIIYKNLVASYSHMRSTNNTMWVRQFLKFINKTKQNETKANI